MRTGCYFLPESDRKLERPVQWVDGTWHFFALQHSMKKSRSHRSERSAFMLLEALVAVAIFALGVLSLGHCVSNCLAVQRVKAQDNLARRALENRLEEIRSGAVVVSAGSTELLQGSFAGLTLRQTSTPLLRKNETGQDLTGLQNITLEVSWLDQAESHTRLLTFYVVPRLP